MLAVARARWYLVVRCRGGVALLQNCSSCGWMARRCRAQHTCIAPTVHAYDASTTQTLASMASSVAAESASTADTKGSTGLQVPCIATSTQTEASVLLSTHMTSDEVIRQIKGQVKRIKINVGIDCATGGPHGQERETERRREERGR